MPLSQPRSIFGVHEITPYNIQTGQPLGTAKVIAAAALTLEGETIKLYGGSNKYPFASENGQINAEVSFTFSEYPDWLMQLLLGKAPTVNASEPLGFVSPLANKFGTTVQDATVGIDNVAATGGSETDLKFETFTVVAVSATTVNVYGGTDIDFATGTAVQFVDDSLLLNAAPLTIANAGVTVLPGFGIEFTGGSAVAMVAGDTSQFNSRPINVGSTEVTIGSSTEKYTDFGLLIYGQKTGDGRMYEWDIFRANGIGLPFTLTANEFSEAEVTVAITRDSVRDGVFTFTEIKGIVAC